MRKQIFIAALAALSMIACQKEQVPEQAFEGEGDGFVATISNSEATRTTLDGTTVKWNSGDEVSINGIVYKAYPDAQNPTVANLWKKTIKSYTPYAPFTAYYPASLFDGKVATLPSVQKYGSFDLNPMYARSNNSNLEFRNLCAVLAVTVKYSDIAKVKSIRVSSSNCAMCGAFTVSDGNTAVLKDAKAIDKTVTLECGTAVTPASDGTVFYISIPVQTYRNLKIELSSDGSSFAKSMTTKKDEDITVAVSTIYSLTFKADASVLLPGEFSVSATKKVQFTKGNLYYSTTDSKYHIESAQNVTYATLGQTTYDATHVCHFFWVTPSDATAAATAPWAESFGTHTRTTTDEFWCGEANALTVDGQNGLYALTGGSSGEWSYLFRSRSNASSLYKQGVSVTTSAGTVANCVVIAPDGYTGTIASSYDAAAWATAESSGLVCLPAAGYRDGSTFKSGGTMGYYCSATPKNDVAVQAYFLTINSSYISPHDYMGRGAGYSVRLVSTVSK